MKSSPTFSVPPLHEHGRAGPSPDPAALPDSAGRAAAGFALRSRFRLQQNGVEHLSTLVPFFAEISAESVCRRTPRARCHARAAPASLWPDCLGQIDFVHCNHERTPASLHARWPRWSGASRVVRRDDQETCPSPRAAGAHRGEASCPACRGRCLLPPPTCRDTRRFAA